MKILSLTMQPLTLLSWSIHVTSTLSLIKNISILSQKIENSAMQLQKAGDGVSEAMYWLSMYKIALSIML